MAKKQILTIWTIYDHPRDYPDKYVVRGWDISNEGDNTPRREVTLHDTLESARESLPPDLCRQAPWDNDDPAIIEVWL